MKKVTDDQTKQRAEDIPNAPTRAAIEEARSGGGRIAATEIRADDSGIEIPQSVLDHAGITGELEIVLRTGEIIVRSVPHPRAGWNAAFKDAAGQAE